MLINQFIRVRTQREEALGVTLLPSENANKWYSCSSMAKSGSLKA